MRRSWVDRGVLTWLNGSCLAFALVDGRRLLLLINCILGRGGLRGGAVDGMANR